MIFKSNNGCCHVTAATAAFILSLLVVACSGASGGNDDSGRVLSDSLTYDTVMPDSLLPDSADMEEKKDEPLRIRSREEIRQFIEESPERARYEAGIIPTMAEYVPEYASRLLDNKYDGFIIVDKNTMKLYRYDRYGEEIEHVGMACSKKYGTKHARRDNRTPEGFFTIEGIYDSTDWLYTDDDGNTSQVKGQFGPRFMRLRTPVSSQIGIHGTVAPWSIGGRRSHGCIRITNENILRIHKLCSAGMPVIVSPGPRDMAVNESEGYHVPSVPVKPGVAPCRPGKLSDYEREKSKSEENKTTEETNDSTQNPAPESDGVKEGREGIGSQLPENPEPSAAAEEGSVETPAVEKGEQGGGSSGN